MTNTGLRLGVLSGLLLVCSAVASAATLTVMNTNDSGAGTLRECITVANANPGADTIVFNIPGAGVHTIAPITPLPPLIDVAGVTIDGYSQPGAHPNTLAIGNDAVLTIELSGSLAGPQGIGLDLRSPANTLRGLVVNGYDRLGIAIQKGRGNKVVGCFVGTDAAGSVARPNRSGIGVFFTGEDPHDPAATTSTIIGGTSPADRNVVSGNLDDGISIGVAASSTTIQGSYVGTSADGKSALGNGNTGVNVVEAGTIVGGSVSGAGNLISGNGAFGVALGFIGAGSVEGNLIGTDATGNSALGNGVGVFVFSSQLNSIGGETPAARNVIAFNRGDGIRILGFIAGRNGIAGNSIHDNGGLGIDLVGDGVSPNDGGDADDGPNLLQNFPVLASAVSVSGTTTISGTLNSSPQTVFRVEFFFNETCDPSGFGEGKHFLGSAEVATSASGSASFAVTFPAAVSAGRVVTATATDPDGNTSEFSGCQLVTASPPTGRFFTVPPCRVIDTRNAVGSLGGPALPGQSGRTFALAGACGIPSSAKNVSANLTVAQPAAPGYLTVHPADTSTPLASSINFSAGQTRANNAILKLSIDGSGSVSVENAAPGPVHFILDVNGYFE